MKRGYTALEFKQKIRKLRAVRPDISVSSDFIVGFPGETERDFEATLRLVADVGFDQSFSFIYSRRPGHAGRLAARRCTARRRSSGVCESLQARSTPTRARSASDGRHRAARAGRAARRRRTRASSPAAPRTFAG